MSEERLNYYKEWIEDNEEIVVDSSIFDELVKEIERLHSIIKEVREELNKIDSTTYQGDTDKKTYYKYEQTRIQKILEILKKEENNEPSNINGEIN